MSPKILMLDIETAPHTVYTFGLFNQNISIGNILRPGYTLCFAARWLGTKKVIFKSIHHDDHDDMVKTAHDLLSEADIVVHYNGTSFDVPTLNKEFLLLELDPPDPFKEVDLYKAVRARFRFASNKLDYVVQQLGIGAKVNHKGMELWRDCMDGMDSAWKTMRKYNIQDVDLLEPLYKALLPWIKTHPNHGLWVEDASEPVCRNCGSTNVTKRGVERTSTMTYQRYKCNDCGTPQRGRLRIKPAGEGVLV